MAHTPEQARKKAEAIADAHRQNNVNRNPQPQKPKASHWDMPGYSENQEKAKIDAKWEKERPQRMEDNKKYGTNYKD